MGLVALPEQHLAAVDMHPGELLFQFAQHAAIQFPEQRGQHANHLVPIEPRHDRAAERLHHLRIAGQKPVKAVLRATDQFRQDFGGDGRGTPPAGEDLHFPHGVRRTNLGEDQPVVLRLAVLIFLEFRYLQQSLDHEVHGVDRVVLSKQGLGPAPARPSSSPSAAPLYASQEPAASGEFS